MRRSSEGSVWEMADSTQDTRLPFQWALGQAVHTLAPRVREHVLQRPGTVVSYRGRMRVWRDTGWRGWLASWLLHLGAMAKTMFPETGDDVDFEMEHAVSTDADGCLTMTWTRTFRFNGISRRFDALMRFHQDSEPVVDWIGGLGCLQVELCPAVEDGAIVVRSRREWLCLGRHKIPIPGWLKGCPYVREWQDPQGALRIRVDIHNRVLGRFFGYEGAYSRAHAPSDGWKVTPQPSESVIGRS
jgi:hypothetical protein